MGASRRSRISARWWELNYFVGPNLWVVPLAMTVAALGLFATTRWMDDNLVELEQNLPQVLVADTPADAVVVLNALLGAVAAVLALVFATSILSFSIASSQLGPRLIRRFMRDVTTQITLGGFMATLVFIVLTLSSVRSASLVVPRISMAMSILMALSCFALLVYYVHRVASMIQAPNVVAGVVRDLDEVLGEADSYLPEIRRADRGGAEEAVRRGREGGGAVAARRSGYVQLVDHTRLLDVAIGHDAVIVLERRPGQFVVEGQTLARVVPLEAAEHAAPVLAHAVDIGWSRSLRQDLEFAMAQVAEIGLRALSPAINDTYTGLTCIDWLGSAMVDFGRHAEQSGGYCSDDGVVRVVEPSLRFDRALKSAFDLLRQAGANNPAVLVRMLDVLTAMVPLVPQRHMAALSHQGDLVLDTAKRSDFIGADQADIAHRHDLLSSAIDATRMVEAQRSEA